ncbi:hypothetical protein N7509_010066 [Penicillium cosmopolitanum]|uniref:Restriction endonuclease type IV Mrr domain-containing protein n=1 Tax=Penicillium cosmopolitanum TaxID=1131564 RepID=A0A9W9VQU6_9EURO|nr:uncharacterized protein N7509_010066 [Penicillium cosmopolitanum]KAJ5387525.1 hypothetical protein N7509_010066 [Penicillium cosmopolitanum]
MRNLRQNGLATSSSWSKTTHWIIPSRKFSNSLPKHDFSPFARRLYKLPTAPTPTTQHNNLPTFLTYASHTSLPPTSTVYVGTHYEYTVQATLRQYALSLHRIGGRDDAGIDLIGTWHLPERERERAVRVLVQCKALKTKLGPNLVRELEGALRQAPVGWRTGQTAGMLVSPREATKGVRDTLARSSYPLFWLLVERDGVVKQVLWNSRAGEVLGLDPLAVENRYGTSLAEDGCITSQVALTWDGCDVPDLERVEVDLARSEREWVASWGVELSEVGKDELLDVVERIFPDGRPEVGADGKVAEEHRATVLQALQKH